MPFGLETDASQTTRNSVVGLNSSAIVLATATSSAIYRATRIGELVRDERYWFVGSEPLDWSCVRQTSRQALRRD
jgi:hypothetical protein